MVVRCLRPGAGPRSAHRLLNGLAKTDAEAQTYDAAFRKRLDELGWIDGRNIHIDYRWGAGSVERMRLFAKELVQLNPEVIFTFTTPASAALHAETSTIPIVFSASEPIGSGFVASLANPGGNMTGKINFEASLGSKWLELLHEVAPRVSRVALMSTRTPHRLLVIIWQRSDPLRLHLPSSRSRPLFTVLQRSSLSLRCSAATPTLDLSSCRTPLW